MMHHTGNSKRARTGSGTPSQAGAPAAAEPAAGHVLAAAAAALPRVLPLQQGPGDLAVRVASSARAAAGPGLRHVAPYAHEYRVNCKGRWFGRGLLDVLAAEFKPPAHLRDAIGAAQGARPGLATWQSASAAHARAARLGAPAPHTGT